MSKLNKEARLLCSNFTPRVDKLSISTLASSRLHGFDHYVASLRPIGQHQRPSATGVAFSVTRVTAPSLGGPTRPCPARAPQRDRLCRRHKASIAIFVEAPGNELHRPIQQQLTAEKTQQPGPWAESERTRIYLVGC